MATKDFKFPLQVDNSNGYFELTPTTLETIKQNVILLFATDEEERVVNNQIGSKFRKFLFDPNINSQCQTEVYRLFDLYFPYLEISNLNIVYQDDTTLTKGLIKISISYNIKGKKAISDSLNITIG